MSFQPSTTLLICAKIKQTVTAIEAEVTKVNQVPGPGFTAALDSAFFLPSLFERLAEQLRDGKDAVDPD